LTKELPRCGRYALLLQFAKSGVDRGLFHPRHGPLAPALAAGLFLESGDMRDGQAQGQIVPAIRIFLPDPEMLQEKRKFLVILIAPLGNAAWLPSHDRQGSGW
jgi:hypothetical protein